MWDWDCEDGFLRALELEPDNPGAHHWYATNFLMPLGRFADARKRLERALQLDPASMPIKTSVGLLLHLERQHQAAATHQLTVIATDPGFALAHYFYGQACTEMGRFDDAFEAFRRAKTLAAESPETDSALGHALARAGRARAAEDVLDELIRMRGRRYVSPVLLAQITAALGDHDRTMGYLEEGFALRATELVWLGVRPAFDGLRSDLRFIDLCSRVLPTRLPETPDRVQPGAGPIGTATATTADRDTDTSERIRTDRYS
jgi:tetratricopeptide (TPR) repeat protein